MSDPSIGRSKEVRNALLQHIRALRVAGVEGVAVGGGEGGGLVLMVDVNNRYRAACRRSLKATGGDLPPRDDKRKHRRPRSATGGGGAQQCEKNSTWKPFAMRADSVTYPPAIAGHWPWCQIPLFLGSGRLRNMIRCSKSVICVGRWDGAELEEDASGRTFTLGGPSVLRHARHRPSLQQSLVGAK
jgi:hypothetical protein